MVCPTTRAANSSVRRSAGPATARTRETAHRAQQSMGELKPTQVEKDKNKADRSRSRSNILCVCLFFCLTLLFDSFVLPFCCCILFVFLFCCVTTLVHNTNNNLVLQQQRAHKNFESRRAPKASVRTCVCVSVSVCVRECVCECECECVST